jgi:hypothetical protein
MSDLWIPVIAALGGSALTGLLGFGLLWWQSHKAEQSPLSERRARAYSMLLARSGVIVHIASGFHTAMQFRSGLAEGVTVLLGIQKPLDPLELVERMRADIEPLYEAWSEVWAVGSKEAIIEANVLIDKCGDVMSAATRPGKAMPRFMQIIAGEKWTQAQLDQWAKEVSALAEARRRLAAIARREAGVEVAELFTNGQATLPAIIKSGQTTLPATTK